MRHIEHTESTPRRKSVHQGVVERKSQTLEHGVLALFPFASYERLEEWCESIRREQELEVEPLLFVAAVCGARFELVRLEPEAICRELSDWLTSHPRRMSRELAAVVVEALRPTIERVADQQGWRRGLDWESVEVLGRPDETRGAWAAAVLVDARFVSLGQNAARAVELAQALASALLARDTLPTEFYARRAAASGPSTATLLSKIVDAYEQLLVIQGNANLDPDPGSQSPARALWRVRHRTPHFVFGRDGCEETARQIARSIPASLWVDLEPKAE